jgi:soluble lytic murein transglycosylase-like protein
MNGTQKLILLAGIGAVGYYFYTQNSGDNSPGIITQAAAAVMGYKNVNDGPTWVPVLNDAEAQYALPQDLLCALAFQESSFLPAVIDGTQPSSAGALGMMQLMPQYYSSVQVATPFTADDVNNQITDAANTLVTNYNSLNSWPLAIAAYNAGLGAVQNAGGIPQNGQTPAYVAGILANAPAANV